MKDVIFEKTGYPKAGQHWPFFFFNMAVHKLNALKNLNNTRKVPRNTTMYQFIKKKCKCSLN